MPWGLQRFQQSRQSYFVTFCCYHRRPSFTENEAKRIFKNALERVRRRFSSARCHRFASVLSEQTWEGIWSSFRHYAPREIAAREIGSEWRARDREASNTCISTRIFLCPG